MRKDLLSLSIVAGICTGCTVLTSETFDKVQQAGRAPRGSAYALPRGLAKATLTYVAGKTEFSLRIEQADVIPDPAHQYILRYRSNPAYKDDVKVTTNARGLLTEVKSDTKDETPTIVVNVAKALSAFGALEAEAQAEEQPVELLVRQFDPLVRKDVASVIEAINGKIDAFLGIAGKSCGYYAISASSPAGRALAELTERVKPLDDQNKALTMRKAIVDKRVEQALKKASEDLTVLGEVDCLKPPVGRIGATGGVTGPAAAAKALEPSAKDAAVHAYCQLHAEQAEIDKKLAKIGPKLTADNASITAIKARQGEEEKRCAHVADLKGKPPRASITVYDYLSRDPVTSDAPVVNASPPADCSIGLCYRAKEPFRIVYSLGAGDDTAEIGLPNRSPLIAIDIRRTFFAQKVQNMTFVDGFLTDLHIDKHSELVELSLIPVSVLTAINAGLTLNLNLITEQTNVARERAALIKAKADLAEAMTKRATGGLEAVGQPRRLTRGGASSRTVAP